MGRESAVQKAQKPSDGGENENVAAVTLTGGRCRRRAYGSMRANFFSRFVIVSGVCATAAFFNGCSTVPLDETGEMQAVYISGEFQMLMNADARATSKATSEAFRQLGYFEIKNQRNNYDALLVGRTPKDAKVTVRIKEINSRQSELSIRVNVAGDKALSRQIFYQIEKNLGGSGAPITAR
jgi:hypothetical protein